MFSRSVPKSSTSCTNIYLANFVPLHKVNHVLVNIFSYLFIQPPGVSIQADVLACIPHVF